MGGAITALFVRLNTGAKLTSAFAGMLLAHAGVGVFVLAVTLVKSYEAERDVRLAPGESVTLGGYAFRFDGVKPVEGPNYSAARAAVTVTKDGATVARLAPEKRVYHVQRNPMTEASIHYGLARHIYVALGDDVGNGAWTVRVHIKPFIGWIWGGCVLMGLGGLLAAADRRYRAGKPGGARAGAQAPDATVVPGSTA